MKAINAGFAILLIVGVTCARSNAHAQARVEESNVPEFKVGAYTDVTLLTNLPPNGRVVVRVFPSFEKKIFRGESLGRRDRRKAGGDRKMGVQPRP